MSNQTFMTEADFIDGVLLRPVPFLVPDFGLVEVRGLSVVEIRDIRNKHKDDPIMQTVEAVATGMTKPKLSAPGIKALHEGNPGPIGAIGTRIFELSGQGDKKQQDPLAGSGS